jgi:alpha-mannosidase
MKPLDTIYVVFKTHVDLGFTDLPSNIVKQYTRDMAQDVLTICEGTRHFEEGHRFVWTVPSWVLEETLIHAEDDIRQRIEQLVVDGQLSWHGLPFTTHTEFCGLEEWIRGLYISSQLGKKFGKKVISAKMTDVPGHTWMLPSLLKGAGIEFLHIGVNACSQPVNVPRLFNWEGPDGKKVLTFYSKGEYGTSLLPPDDWEYPVWMALLQTHDNIGPQDSQVVTDLLETVQASYPNTKVVIGTMDDFAADFLSRGYTDIPVVRKDLADTWIHGIGSYPEEVAEVRSLRNETKTLETIATFEQWEMGTHKAEFAPDIHRAYRESLLFGEHTWGHDVKLLLLPGRNSMRVFEPADMAQDRELFPETYEKLERSWDEKRAYVSNAREAVGRIKPFSKGEAAAIGIFNPSSWTRTNEIITLEAKSGGSLIDLETGERLQVHASGEVLIPKLEACGYRAYTYDLETQSERSAHIEIASSHKEKAALENDHILLEIDANTGHVRRLYDKIHNKEWVAPDQPFGIYEYDVYGKEEILQFVKDYGYDLMDWYVNDFGKPGYPRIEHKKFGLKLESLEALNISTAGIVRMTFSTPVESHARYGNAQHVVIELKLEPNQPYLDYSIELNEKAATAFAEAGFAGFHLQADNPRYQFQKLGAVVDPTEDIICGANHRLHCGDGWVDVTDGELGLAVLAKETPLFSIGEKGVFAYSKSYKPEQATLYFNLFNNQWGTNFPQWMSGNYTYHYRFVVHQGNWQQSDLWKRMEQWQSPLTTVSEFRGKTFRSSLLAADAANVIFVAFKLAENGNGYILRIQNALDEVHEADLAFAQDLASAYACSLLEEEEEKLTIKDKNRITMSLGPREIKTLKLQFHSMN